ncbi:MAG: murein biosynthesis integral membrane protein MurJ [Phycisphaeraceae bacterium]|nr:murein biosynthesis integral membrane protein MurJ [Phycisphaeraceae bacterium]
MNEPSDSSSNRPADPECATAGPTPDEAAGGREHAGREAESMGRWEVHQGEGSPSEPGGGFIGSARLVSLLTLASRISGLVRDAVLAAVLGMAAVADAFFLAFLVPNLFRRLFGEGALSAAFIPKYAQLLESDRELAARFAGLCFWVLAAALLGLVIVGEVLLLGLSAARWPEETALAIRLAMLMLPYMPLVCMVALIGGILQVRGRFGSTSAAPVVLNLLMIAGAAWGSSRAADEPDAATVIPIALSVLVAGVLQVGWQIAAVLRFERLRFNVQGVTGPFKSMLIMMLPMLLGLAVFQVNAFFDGLLAFFLSPKGDRDTINLFGYVIACPMREGSVAALQWAQRLYQFPLGVFGIAVATAVFPALARAAARRDDPMGAAAGAAVEARATAPAEFGQILRQGLRLTVFIGLPASVGMMIVATPLCRAVYERGRFELDDAIHVSAILFAYASAIWAYSMMHVLTRGLYALHDSRTPLRISLICVGFNLVCNMILIWPLGAAGLAWSTALSAVLQVVLLMRSIRRRIDRTGDIQVVQSWGWTMALSLLMAFLLAPWLVVFNPAMISWTESSLLLAGLVLAGAGVYLLAAHLTRRPELTWLLSGR